jgi:hypothetical protein
MRDSGCEVDRVRADVHAALVGGAPRVGRARFAALVGSTLVCGVGLWCPGPVGIASALAAACPNEASRQGPSVDLPECRVYEQVTPVDKGDATDIFGSLPKGEEGIVVDEGNKAYVAEEGGAILVHTDGSFARQATATASSYVFSRGAEGWHMNVLAQSIAAPQEVGEEGPELYDPLDLSEVGFSELSGADVDLLGGEEAALHRSYLVGPVGGPYAPLYSLIGSAISNAENWVEPIGGADNLSRVVMQSKNHSLGPGAEGQDAGTEALYETTGRECGATSSCRLVDVKPEGGAMPCGAALGQGVLGGGGAYSAVSSDGSRIFFTAPEPENSGPGCWNPEAIPHQEDPPELYVREGGTRTVEISVPREEGLITAENPLLPAVFVGASSDGSKVFFMTRTELTKNAVGHTPELYEYETESGRLMLVSADESGAVEGDVDSVTAISSDGSTVYFSAFGKLAAEASEYPPGGGLFSPVNLYGYDTVTGVTTYIATLNKDDYPGHFGGGSKWYTNEMGGSGTENEGVTYAKEWYTTADGQFLVFGTVLPLTGFDNVHAPGVVKCPNNYSGEGAPEGCFELYRYDATTGQIVCVSCAGGAPVDGAYFARIGFDAPASGPPRPISEDGEDVFFESANALVPQAILGRDHVYEWHDGTISLISSPDDPGNAIFLGSSAEGSDVFFVTHAQLSARDTDQAADIYDARLDGGFPEVRAPECTGTGCQGLPAAPPVFATPASVTFEGVGNFTASEPPGKSASKSKARPKKCKAGLVRRHGACVRRKTGKAKRSARGRK